MQTSRHPDTAGHANILLHQPYLIVCPIPYHEAPDGGVFLDRLWHRDFMEHFAFLADIHLIAPRLPVEGQPDLVRVEVPADRSLTLHPLPHAGSAAQALLQLPVTAWRMLRAVRAGKVIHSGVAGWPYSLGMLANPLAWLLRRRLVIVIESSFWRVNDPATASRKARLRSNLTEAFARWSVRRADLSIFTSTAYRDSLVTTGRGRTLVSPASWINEEDIVVQKEAPDHAGKQDVLHLVFAGRLNAAKGVGVLLDALRLLDRRGCRFRIDIIGEGDLNSACKVLSGEMQNVDVQVLPPLPYGADFFAFLGLHHAALVLSLTDEQPRIIFDAYAQGVPVIASATSGHRDCVADGKTGYLLPPGDAGALADRIAALADDPGTLRRMADAATEYARAHTHREMHRTRAREIAAILTD